MTLLGLLQEHRGQLAADFPRFYGIPISRIREEVTLWEFAAMAVNLPRESATWRAINGADVFEWDLSAQLLAEIANAVKWLQWSKTEDAEKRRLGTRPDLILPPWVQDPTKEVTVFGSDPVPLDELDDFLGWNYQAA